MKVSQYIYAIQFGPYVKIGTTQNPPARLRTLPGGTIAPDDLDPDCEKRPLMAVPGNFATERLLHALLDDYRVTGEWFKLPDHVISVLLRQNSDEKRASMFKLGDDWIPMKTVTAPLPRPVDF